MIAAAAAAGEDVCVLGVFLLVCFWGVGPLCSPITTVVSHVIALAEAGKGRKVGLFVAGSGYVAGQGFGVGRWYV